MLDFATAISTSLEFHVIRWWREYVALVAVLAIACGIIYFFLLTPPADFPADVTIHLSEGTSLPAIADELARDHLIKNPQVFDYLVRLIGNPQKIHAGRYRFNNPQSALIIALRLLDAKSDIPPVRLTFPEGSTNAQMAALVHGAYPDISANDFLSAALGKQGYLFPDTYNFTPDTTLDEITQTLSTTFNHRIATIQSSLTASSHNLHDIIIMASIIEAETNTPADRRIVSGILWKRLSLGMPLQVDAAPDTYKKKGLPIDPINNPGLDSIVAAALPTASPYLYYLTGKDGMMHYAVTYAEHQANLAKYLK